jgi:hypothetical protein
VSPVRRTILLTWLAAGTFALGAVPVVAQETSASPGILLLSEQADGASVENVSVRLGKSGGSPDRDREALQFVQGNASALEGQPFDSLEIRSLVARLESSGAVSRVSYRLLPGTSVSSIRIALTVDAKSAEKEEAFPKGVLTGEIADFPVFYQDGRSLVTAIIAGGVGVYSDSNSWFGQPFLFNQFSPIAGDLPGKRSSWTEGSLEVGAGFATQIGDMPLYAFGALTGMKTWSVGQDIFRDDNRNFDAIEKAYAGLLYADASSRNKARMSIGRQTFTLNDGFLVNMVKGSGNAGVRGASYLGPRLTNDFSVLADGRFGAWGFSLFYIDPNELELVESGSTFLGINGKYSFNQDVAVDATFITIPESRSTFANPHGLVLEREGLNTIAGHLKWRNLGIDGLWAEAEAAYQFHPDYAMSAWAAYGTLGYIARDLPWTPSLSYRYAHFSGDDPATTRYERFDPLLSTGLGIWLQGLSFGKLTSNSNLETHRVQLNVAPLETLNVTFDYHSLRAPELNNLGSNPALATLTSDDLGDEFTLSARWAINRNLYLQGVASYAVPGKALRNIGATDDWATFQLSLYWGL